MCECAIAPLVDLRVGFAYPGHLGLPGALEQGEGTLEVWHNFLGSSNKTWND